MSRTPDQGLLPLPQVSITSDRLRQMARELMIQADALDALVERPKAKKRKNVPLIDPRQENLNARL